MCWGAVIIKSRVPDQNGTSQAGYVVEINHSGPEPPKCSSSYDGLINTAFFSLEQSVKSVAF